MITTPRLTLVPLAQPIIRAALEGPEALSQALNAGVPATWPPEYLDPPALSFVLDRLGQYPEQAGWWLYAVLLGAGAARTLIGSAGYKGPPDAEGTVEVGYGIVSDQRRRGFASEATRGLLKRAFGVKEVNRVIAETYPDLTGSIGVLVHCGFRLIGEGSEPGIIRFELRREAYRDGVDR